MLNIVLLLKYHVLQVYNPELAVEETVTLEIVHTIKLHRSLNLNIAIVPVWPPTYFWTGFQVGTQRFAAQVVEEIRRLICTTNVHQDLNLNPHPDDSEFSVLRLGTRSLHALQPGDPTSWQWFKFPMIRIKKEVVSVVIRISWEEIGPKNNPDISILFRWNNLGDFQFDPSY